MKILDKSTLVPIGFVLSLLSLFIGGAVFINNEQIRLAKIEVDIRNHIEDPSLHHKSLDKIEEESLLTRELLIEIRAIKERLTKIERKIEG